MRMVGSALTAASERSSRFAVFKYTTGRDKVVAGRRSATSRCCAAEEIRCFARRRSEIALRNACAPVLTGNSVPDCGNGEDTRMSEAALPRTAPHGAPRLGAITLTALGIVYGDIGTSPLYALKQAADAGGALSHETILGIVSLIFWALILIVSLEIRDLDPARRQPRRGRHRRACWRCSTRGTRRPEAGAPHCSSSA